MEDTWAGERCVLDYVCKPSLLLAAPVCYYEEELSGARMEVAGGY